MDALDRLRWKSASALRYLIGATLSLKIASQMCLRTSLQLIYSIRLPTRNEEVAEVRGNRLQIKSEITIDEAI